MRKENIDRISYYCHDCERDKKKTSDLQKLSKNDQLKAAGWCSKNISFRNTKKYDKP